MIRINELRVGNLLRCNSTKEYRQITITDLLDLSESNDAFDYCPIDINKKILLRFGFSELPKDKKAFKDKLLFQHGENAERILWSGGCVLKPSDNGGYIIIAWNILYAHRLQNLYHAIKGEELGYE